MPFKTYNMLAATPALPLAIQFLACCQSLPRAHEEMQAEYVIALGVVPRTVGYAANLSGQKHKTAQVGLG